MRIRIVALALGVVSALCITGCAPSSTAYMVDYPYYSSIDELAQASGLVVRGTVISSRVENVNTSISTEPTSTNPTLNPQAGMPSPAPVPDSYMVYTYYKINVTDCYKGCDLVGTTIEIAEPGGRYKGVNYECPSSVPLDQDKTYILFGTQPENGSAYLLSPSQAVYEGDPDAVGNYGGVSSDNELKLTQDQLQALT